MGVVPFYPESVISVMMIIDYVFEQMLCRFDGAMGFHCNREATKQMTKRRLYPESVISVMMIIDFVFEQMLCRFDGAMGFHCN